MKIRLTAILMTALLGLAWNAGAHEMGHHKSTSITGEIVDTGCYLGHASRGAGHADCASQCIRGGMPMGLLTNRGTLYLITMNHDNPDAYNKLKAMAGKKVTVSGAIIARQGMKGIDVVSFKPAV